MTPHRVALVMISRNEAARIVRALASARPCVDELVVLDTGSTDATVALARSAGARVAYFDWIDDFSAARNAALDLADADWNLIVDADEWIAERGVDLLALRHTQARFRRHGARREPIRHTAGSFHVAQLVAAHPAARRPLLGVRP